MKKLALVLVLSVSCMASAAEVDWRSTALSNVAMDIVQTNDFMGKGREAWNPIVAGMVNSHDHFGFTATALVGSYLIDRGLQSMNKEWRKIGYIVWSAVEIAACANNSREFGVGFPMLVVRF